MLGITFYPTQNKPKSYTYDDELPRTGGECNFLKVPTKLKNRGYRMAMMNTKKEEEVRIENKMKTQSRA